MQSSGYSYLDRSTCRAIRRYARFQTEQDEAGNPVESSYTSTIAWSISEPDIGDFWFSSLELTYPAEALNAGWEGTTQVEIVIGVDEQPTSCEVLTSSGHPTLDEATCEGLMALDGGERVAYAYRGADTRTVRRGVIWEVPEGNDDSDDY